MEKLKDMKCAKCSNPGTINYNGKVYCSQHALLELATKRRTNDAG